MQNNTAIVAVETNSIVVGNVGLSPTHKKPNTLRNVKAYTSSILDSNFGQKRMGFETRTVKGEDKKVRVRAPNVFADAFAKALV